jgi:hypothetical protein
MRVVSWFSCGAASAVATKIAVDKYKTVDIVYCDTGSEHPDNMRFLKDCSKWFGVDIQILRSTTYKDTWDVFEKTKYLVGPKGARCTTELKKVIRNSYQRVDDIQVFGFDLTEIKRAERFKTNNPEVCLETPLIDNNVSKKDCFQILVGAGIEIPAMYRLGYKNNNCIGCVKGGAGYWNKIRVDFPDVFEQMSCLERKLNISLIRLNTEGKKRRVFLDELPPDTGRYEAEPSLGCGVLCDVSEPEL